MAEGERFEPPRNLPPAVRSAVVSVRARSRPVWPGVSLKRELQGKLIEHKHYIDTHGEDMPEIRHWRWGPADAGSPT